MHTYKYSLTWKCITVKCAYGTKKIIVLINQIPGHWIAVYETVANLWEVFALFLYSLLDETYETLCL